MSETEPRAGGPSQVPEAENNQEPDAEGVSPVTPDAFDAVAAPISQQAGQGHDRPDRRAASLSGEHVMGTGEGPPPGTRVEALLVSIIALVMVVLPVLGSLRRIADTLIESQAPRLGFLLHGVGRGLSFFLPKDLSWASVYVQNGTLWIGFLGAVLATVGGKHLGLSTTNFMSHGRLRTAFETFSNVVSVLVLLVLAYGSARMVAADRAGGGDLLPGGIHPWMIEMIIPVSFAVMAVRVVVRATNPLLAHMGPHGAPPPALLEAIPPLTKAQRLRRLVLCSAIGVLAALALYVGMRYDGSTRLQTLIGRLDTDGMRRTVRLLSLGGMTLAFLLGTPVFVVMAGLAMGLFFAASTPVASLPAETYRLVANPSLPAIPLLTIAGYVLASGNASHRLVRAYKSVFGWMPGGMAVMVVFVCALFTTFTGASGVTILALGGLVYPMLVRDKYQKGFAMGLVTAAGSLGLLFPPSLPVLLYSVTASSPGSAAPVSVEQLYIGGLLPGLFLVVLVSLYGIQQGVKAKAPRQPFRRAEVLHALWAAKWDLMLPVLVMATFATGVATVVEAAAIGAAYALCVELFVYRDVHPFYGLPGVLVHAAALVGAVVVLLGVALGLTNYLVLAEVPMKLVEWVQTHIHSQWVFLLVLNVMLLVLGSVLEIYSAIVVLVPLVAPLGVAFEVHPVHLGVIFLSNLELGFLCPPMGLNLFLSATRFHKPLPLLYRRALPFLLIMSIGVLVITYVPWATLGLLKLLGKN
jgi:tripartite ATP-independent transporter DctM subunit